MSNREPAAAEIETLRAVLVAVLPKTGPDQLTAVAIESATAVRAAFERLSKESLSE
ncbi:hypothetical protein [Pseudomonas huaxiensis]|uniref:hypothetical protein n=1 Tax=Pseudomonas huaxiensis TaxID=2213017 RepID=UPI001300A4D1|nr:hypothetical protein [Pseudomonas huaxiensis]